MKPFSARIADTLATSAPRAAVLVRVLVVIRGGAWSIDARLTSRTEGPGG